MLKTAKRRSSSHLAKAAAASASMLSSRTQSFTCSAELLRAFEQRAFDLGCSFDWLVEEAMQRLLAEEAPPLPPVKPIEREETTDRRMELPSAPPESLERRVMTPLPLPPDSMPKTLPPPPARVERSAPVAVVPEPPPAREPVLAPSHAPLVLEADGERFVIERLPFIIGRSPSACQLVIDDGLVSRKHAAIERRPDGWAVVDLGSTNGIIIDGETVRHAYLRRGMVMTIGPLTFGVISS